MNSGFIVGTRKLVGWKEKEIPLHDPWFCVRFGDAASGNNELLP